MASSLMANLMSKKSQRTVIANFLNGMKNDVFMKPEPCFSNNLVIGHLILLKIIDFLMKLLFMWVLFIGIYHMMN